MLQRVTLWAKTLVALAVLSCAALMLTGCSSDEKKPAPAPAPTAQTAAAPTKPPVTMSQIKTDLINAKAQLATTTASLTALKEAPAAEAPSRYNTFATEYVKLQKSGDNLHQEASDLRQRSKAYFDAWSKESSSNPEIQRQAIQQRAEANKTFATISSEMDLARLTYDDYMKNAKDVGSYLKDNVTPGRVQTVSDSIGKMETQSAELTKHIDAILGGVDQMMAKANG